MAPAIRGSKFMPIPNVEDLDQDVSTFLYSRPRGKEGVVMCSVNNWWVAKSDTVQIDGKFITKGFEPSCSMKTQAKIIADFKRNLQNPGQQDMVEDL